jgi:hypothetical protein
LVSVTACAALVVPISWAAKARLAGETVSVAGLSPVPESCAVCVPALSTTVNDP